MSYEGYEEYICEKGHYWIVDCYGSARDVEKCRVCQSKVKYWHAVDVTNGTDYNDPSTYAASIKELGFEDSWHTDHYGNRYATKMPVYEPDDPQWKLNSL